MPICLPGLAPSRIAGSRATHAYRLSVITAERNPSWALGATLAVPIAAMLGASLGALAVFVDEINFVGARLLLVFVSTGLSWGAAAILMGAVSRERFVACVAGTLVLVSAVAAYYGLHGSLGLRDAPADALWEAGRSWGMAALVGGPFLGFFGWGYRFGGRRESSIALGVLCGLLLGQGLRWALRYGINPDPVLTSALVGPLILLALGLRGRSLPLATAALLVTAAFAAAAWSVLESIG